MIFCDKIIQPFELDQDITIISKVLHDIVDEFVVKLKIRFIILLFYAIPDFTLEIFNDFVANINGKFQYTHEYSSLGYSIYNPHVLLLKSTEEFKELVHSRDVYRHLNQPIMFFVFIQNLTLNELESSVISENHQHALLISGSIWQYSFFITNEADIVSFSTVEWFSAKACDKPYLNRLNSFDKRSMKWDSKLKNYEKFMNYHGCELVLMLPAVLPGKLIEHKSVYSRINDESYENHEIHGIVPKVFEIAAKFYNFSPEYQPVIADTYWLIRLDGKPYNLVQINKTYKDPNVFFEVLPIGAASFFIEPSNAIITTKVYIFVTPAEEYSLCEIFYRSLSLEMWILVCAILLIVSLSFFI